MSIAEVISFSFCQVSDLNLDAGAAFDLHLSPVQRKQRQEESIEALAQAIKMASSDDVSAVLVPGNFFDAENITTSALSSLQNIFARLQEIPVFIAPGAGDPLFADSLYNEAALRAHGLAPWSENVHIFQSGELQTYTLPGKSSIKISGIGLTKDGRRQTPVIPPLSESDKVAINILLLPLGLADTESGVLDSKLKTYIKSLGYSYTALSGLKNAVTLIGDNDAVAAACAGTFIGQRQQEKGLRQALFGNLDRRIAGGLDITVRPEEFDPRRIVSLNFDVTGKDPSLLKDLLKETMQASGARPLIDMVVLNLEGTYPGAQELDLVSQAKEFDFFQLRIVDNTRPDYLETLSDKNVIESRFASMMNELKEQATAGGADQEKSRQAVIKDALYYGLEAIRQGRVTIRHAD